MTDPAENHQAKRFCMDRPSHYVPVQLYNENISQMVKNRLAESGNYSNLAIPRHIRLGTHFAGVSWSPAHLYEVPFNASNQIGRLPEYSFNPYAEQSFEQIYPLNLSTKSLGSASNVSSSPDHVAIDFSTKAKDSSTKFGNSWKNDSSNDGFGSEIDASGMNHTERLPFSTNSIHNIGNDARTSLNIAQESSLPRSASGIGNRSKNVDRLDSLRTNGRASSIASSSRNGSSWINGRSSINNDDIERLSNKENIKSLINGSSWTADRSSLNITATNNDPLNGITSIKEHSSQKRTCINPSAWTNDSSSTSSLNTPSPNANCNSEIVYDSNIAKISKESDTALINTVSAPMTVTTTLPTKTNDPVLDVLNIFLGMDGTIASEGRSFDPNESTVNSILWRVQEALRLTQLLPDDPTEEDMNSIVDVLERPGVKPDFDEVCLIKFNQNLARNQGNGPRRSIMGHMDRIVNNDSSRTCRIQHTATAAQVSNDVFVQMKRQKQLTKRYSEELTTLNYLQELMTQMGLKCDMDSEDDDENGEENEQDVGWIFDDMLGPGDIVDIKKEVDSDDEEQEIVID